MDRVTAAARSANMRAIRSIGMKPEMVVRRFAHSLGYRYRLHRSDLPGAPDMVFPSLRKIIFVHGCFWHQHKNQKCKGAHMPQSNLGYWRPKLARNVDRDARNLAKLKKSGWRVLVIWECETKNGSRLALRLKRFLKQMG